MELPEVGSEMEATKSFGVVESVKGGVGRVLAGVGDRRRSQRTLNDAPGTVNESSFESGWLMKVKVSDVPASLMTPQRTRRGRVNAPSPRKSYIYYTQNIITIAERVTLIAERKRDKERIFEEEEDRRRRRRRREFCINRGREVCSF